MSEVGDLGRRVAERRTELGLSDADLAGLAGMAPSYVRALEHNPSPQLSRAALWRLAAALGTSVEELTGGGTQLPSGQTSPSAPPVLDDLDEASCRSLIGPGGIGRVVFPASGRLAAYPVNYRMLDGQVVVRTSRTSSLVRAIHEAPAGSSIASFEVDHIDEALAEGWSVLVSGPATLVEDAATRARVDALDVTPWAGGDRDAYVRIAADQITGRRIRRS